MKTKNINRKSYLQRVARHTLSLRGTSKGDRAAKKLLRIANNINKVINKLLEYAQELVVDSVDRHGDRERPIKFSFQVNPSDCGFDEYDQDDDKKMKEIALKVSEMVTDAFEKKVKHEPAYKDGNINGKELENGWLSASFVNIYQEGADWDYRDEVVEIQYEIDYSVRVEEHENYEDEY